MADLLDKSTQTRTWFTATSYLYVADNSKGAGLKDAKVLASELLGLGGNPGYIPFVHSSGNYQAGDAGLFFDPVNEFVSIGLTGSPTPRNSLHLHKASTAAVGIRFTNSDTGVTASDGQEIDADNTGLRYKVVSGDSHQFQVAGSEVARITSGGITIGDTALDASALLELTSTSKGVLFPRMTTAQRNAISSPADGLIIYNTTDSGFQYYDGTSWTSIGSGSGSGGLTATSYSGDIDLTTDRVYNTKISPVTSGAINFSSTGAVNGTSGFIIYQAASKPTVTLDSSTANVDIIGDSFVADATVLLWYSYYVDTNGLKGLLINYRATNRAPVITDLIGTSSYIVGESFTLSFTYTDNENDAAGVHTTKFFYADDTTGTYETQFGSGTGNTPSVVIPSAAENKFIGAEVTPIAVTGASPGSPVKVYFNTQVTTGTTFTLLEVEGNYSVVSDVGSNGAIQSVNPGDGSTAITLYDTGDSIDITFSPSAGSGEQLKVFLRSGDSAGQTTKFGHYNFELSNDSGSSFTPISGTNGAVTKQLNIGGANEQWWGFKEFSGLTFAGGGADRLRITATNTYCLVDYIEYT